MMMKKKEKEDKAKLEDDKWSEVLLIFSKWPI